MQVKHIGLVCRREEDADWFFGEFMGLEKSARKDIPAATTLPLFGIDAGLTAYNYSGRGLHFEVFITDDDVETVGRIPHICLAADDHEKLITRAGEMGVTVLRAPRGQGWVTFLKDRDGHLFEIK